MPELTQEEEKKLKQESTCKYGKYKNKSYVDIKKDLGDEKIKQYCIFLLQTIDELKEKNDKANLKLKSDISLITELCNKLQK
jgi:hypothetical protein